MLARLHAGSRHQGRITSAIDRVARLFAGNGVIVFKDRVVHAKRVLCGSSGRFLIQESAACQVALFEIR